MRTLYVGCIAFAAVISVWMALPRYCGNGGNVNRARAGVAFIFIHSVVYASFFNSTVFTVPAEYFPAQLRGYGTAIAFMCESITSVWLTQVTPVAFETITYRYYLIFICTLVALGVFCFFCVKETNQMTFESIAGNFGDEVISVDKGGAVVQDEVELDRARAVEEVAL